MLLLGAAAAVVIAADGMFCFLSVVQGEVAHPSSADVGYLAAYPLGWWACS
jgi:hypothetical protein